MQICLPNVDLALTLAMWERQRESLCENRNSMSSFNQQSCFFIKNIEFSLEKCRFGATKGVLHYVLRRDWVIFAKNDNFELEICVKTKKGRTALQNGRPLSLICQPVKHGAPARQYTSVHVSSAYGDPSSCFSRTIDRESLAGVNNSLKIWSVFNHKA